VFLILQNNEKMEILEVIYIGNMLGTSKVWKIDTPWADLGLPSGDNPKSGGHIPMRPLEI